MVLALTKSCFSTIKHFSLHYAFTLTWVKHAFAPHDFMHIQVKSKKNLETTLGQLCESVLKLTGSDWPTGEQVNPQWASELKVGVPYLTNLPTLQAPVLVSSLPGPASSLLLCAPPPIILQLLPMWVVWRSLPKETMNLIMPWQLQTFRTCWEYFSQQFGSRRLYYTTYLKKAIFPCKR